MIGQWIRAKLPFSKYKDLPKKGEMTEFLFRNFIFEWRLLSVVFAVFLTYATGPWFDKYSYGLYDAIVKVVQRPAPPVEDVVIITIDEASIQHLGRWPWSRHVHAELLHSLQSAAPKVVAFNVIFSEVASNKSASLAFKQAISASAFPVVLPVLDHTQHSDFFFRTPNTLLATSRIQVDTDAVIRRVQLLRDTPHELLPQLSLQAYWGAGYDALQSKDLQKPLLINFSDRQHRNFKEIPYHEVLSGAYAAEDIAGKIVVVGTTAPGLGDRFVTTMSKLHNSTYIQAELIQNLVQDSFIEPIEGVSVHLLRILVIVLFFGFLYVHTKIHIAYVALIFSALTLCITLVLLRLGYWWSPLCCIIFFLGSWLIWYWRRSVAVLKWCRTALNYSRAYAEYARHEQRPVGKKPLTQNLFSFELTALEKTLKTAEALQLKKDAFRTYLSHDLRTPQVSMMDLLNTQKDPATALPEQEFSARMEALIQTSLVMLDDLLVLSKGDVDLLKLEPILLAAVVQDALDYLWPQFYAKNIAVSFITEADELGEILGDAKLLQRAFANILENSVRYAGAQTSISITLKKDSRGVVLTIADSGQCAAGEYSDGVVRAAPQAQQMKTGRYGLGLALVQSAIKLHQASFSSSELETGGVAFEFIFPAVGSEASS